MSLWQDHPTCNIIFQDMIAHMIQEINILNWLREKAYMYNKDWAVDLSYLVNVLQTKIPTFTVIVKENVKECR